MAAPIASLHLYQSRPHQHRYPFGLWVALLGLSLCTLSRGWAAEAVSIDNSANPNPSPATPQALPQAPLQPPPAAEASTPPGADPELPAARQAPPVTNSQLQTDSTRAPLQRERTVPRSITLPPLPPGQPIASPLLNLPPLRDLVPSNSNPTAFNRGGAGADEHYILSLRAPDIDNNTFPVPVLYFDDLIGRMPPRAVLQVPVRLSIRNSRQRRLLTLFTMPGGYAVPYGRSLAQIAQLGLPSYNDARTRQRVAEPFVGPNKRIFRALEDGRDLTLDFTVPIDIEHFHGGYLTIGIAASNGVELSQPCETTRSSCVQNLPIRLVPRQVTYQIASGTVLAAYPTTAPVQRLTITSSNVDLQLFANNVALGTIDHRRMPFSQQFGFVLRDKFNPHIDIQHDDGGFTQLSHIDLYPIYRYMSNNAYTASDTLVATLAVRNPDLSTRFQRQGRERLRQLGISNAGESNAAPGTEKSPLDGASGSGGGHQ